MTSSRIDKYSEKAISVESNLPPRRKTAAILTDSKGDYLSGHVTNIVETDILWWTKKGCTTERGAKWLVENFNKKKKDHGHLCIYVWLGTCDFTEKGRKYVKVSNGAKIRNRYNQVPHLTQDTNGKVTNSQKTPQTRAKRSALSQQVTTKHI